MRHFKTGTRIGALTVALVTVAAIALNLSNGSPENVQFSAAAIVPGTAGTVMTAAERDKVVSGQGGQTDLSPENPYPPEPVPGVIGVGGCGDSKIPLIKDTNGWLAGGFRGEKYMDVIVCAGAYRKNPNTGYFLIVRNRFPGATTKFYKSLVENSGPVKITDAPLGEEGSAHVWDAHIQFESELGTVGYLDLSDDSIHITNGPTSCPSDASGTPPNCGEPKLANFKVVPSRRMVRVGRTVGFSAAVENTGEANAWQVQVCVKGPRKLVQVKGGYCHRVYKLGPNETSTAKFKIKVKKKPKPGRKATLWFKATSYDGRVRHAKAAMRVRSR